MIEQLITSLIQNAPGVAVCVWAVWRYDSRQQILVDALVVLAQRCKELEVLIDK